MKIVSQDGVVLDASFSVAPVEGGAAVTIESRGPSRNSDYTVGLETLLWRLQELDAILADAFLDTEVTRQRGLDESERRLDLPRDLTRPLALRDTQPAELAVALKRAQRLIGQRPGAKGGNETRRMVMIIRPGGRPLPELLEPYLAGVPRMGVVYVPGRPQSAKNLEIGLEWGVWGFNSDAMQRSTYLQELQTLRAGDLIFLGHRGPSPRVPSQGWADASVKRGHLGVVTGIDLGARDPVWPDDVYPYRLHIDFVGQYDGFDASRVGTDVMEALRLSANQQGRLVVVPVNRTLLTDPVAASNPLALDGPLDNLIQSTHRREQRRLRDLRLGSSASAPCDLCGKELPIRYLRMAHIKQRALCTHDEQLDPNIVMSACAECDALFEAKELVVDDAGIVRALPRPDATASLESLLASRHGRSCSAFSEATRSYFAFHRS